MKKMVNDMEETQITYKIKKMRVGEEQRIIPARLYPVFAEDGEESPSFLALKQLLEESNTKD